MSVVLTEAVERAVTTALDNLNGELEALVAAELDRQLKHLAAGLLADRLEVADNTSCLPARPGLSSYP